MTEEIEKLTVVRASTHDRAAGGDRRRHARAAGGRPGQGGRGPDDGRGGAAGRHLSGSADSRASASAGGTGRRSTPAWALLAVQRLGGVTAPVELGDPRAFLDKMLVALVAEQGVGPCTSPPGRRRRSGSTAALHPLYDYAPLETEAHRRAAAVRSRRTTSGASSSGSTSSIFAYSIEEVSPVSG